MKNPRLEVIKYAKKLNSKKLSALRSGNISVRYKDGFLITPSGAKYSTLKKKDIIFVSNKGKFNYVLMRSSGNRVFDEALIDFLEKQKMISYPSHDSGLKQEITVTFKAEKG